jgi:hypothetical protein
MTIVTATSGRQRLGLDALVTQMTDPGFIMRHRRPPVLRERGGHVSPSMLAMQSPRSKYARAWRRHARRCPECASVFRYLGISIS